MSNAKEPITSVLRRCLKESEISCNQISKVTGVLPSSMSRFIRKERGLDGTSIDRLAEYFGLELVPKAKKKGR